MNGSVRSHIFIAPHAKIGGQLRRSDIWFGVSVPSSASPSMPLLTELIPCVTRAYGNHVGFIEARLFRSEDPQLEKVHPIGRADDRVPKKIDVGLTG